MQRIAGDKHIIIWITGRPASGKTSLANALHHLVDGSVVLDGDQLRQTLSPDLGFDQQSRQTHLYRTVAHAIERQQDAPSQLLIVALISPYATDRQYAREQLSPYGFYEIYNNAPLSTCIARDPKGLYAKAQRGEIADMTGISHPYEEPSQPDLTLDSVSNSPEHNAQLILSQLVLARTN